MNKVKALFTGKNLFVLGAGVAVGFALGLLPAVRAKADEVLKSAGVVQ